MANVAQASAHGFLLPFFRVSVAFKADVLRSDDGILQNLVQGFFLFHTFGHERVDAALEFVQLMSHGCIDNDHRSCTVGWWTSCTELESVTGKGKRRSTVSICIIQQDGRDTADTQLESFLLVCGKLCTSQVFGYLVEHVWEVTSQEDGKDSRWSFSCTQTMAIAGTHDGCTEQVLILVHHHQYVHHEGKEKHVTFCGLGRREEIHSCISTKWPVVVLTRTVHTLEWLFVKQYGKLMLGSDTLHQVHHQLVVVVGKVHVFENWCQLELVRSCFVMTGLYRDTQLVTFDLQFFHEVGHTGRDRTEVVVIQLLVLWRWVSHQCSTGDAKVRTSIVESSIYQEIFLFPSQVSVNTLYIRHEHLAYFGSSLVYSCQCLEQWSLVVECLAGIRDEDGRDTQSLVYDEGWRWYVPCGITTSFEGIADTTVREARCIRFLLYQEFAREAFDYTTVVTEFDESVVLLCRTVGQWLEPVCIVSYIECLCPALHAVGNHVRHFAVEGDTLFDGVDNRLICFGRKEFLHLLAVEYMNSVIFRKFFYRIVYRNRLSVCQFLESKKSHFWHVVYFFNGCCGQNYCFSSNKLSYDSVFFW